MKRGLKWTVTCHDHVLQEGQRAASAALPHETGGILIGWYRGDTINVERFLEVKDPDAGTHSYTRRREQADSALSDFLAREGVGTELGYVGEWHVHPRQQPPSPTDVASLSVVAAKLEEPVLLIVLARRGDDWDVYSYVTMHRRFRRARATPARRVSL